MRETQPSVEYQIDFTNNPLKNKMLGKCDEG